MPPDERSQVLLQLAAQGEQLKTIGDRLSRIEAWEQRHDARHAAADERSHQRAVTLEGRMTKLEGAVGLRSWLGGVGVFLSAAVAFFTRQGAGGN